MTDTDAATARRILADAVEAATAAAVEQIRKGIAQHQDVDDGVTPMAAIYTASESEQDRKRKVRAAVEHCKREGYDVAAIHDQHEQPSGEKGAPHHPQLDAMCAAREHGERGRLVTVGCKPRVGHLLGRASLEVIA